MEQAQLASQNGIRHLVMTGYIEAYFCRLLQVKNHLNQQFKSDQLQTHTALGLHPCFIDQHSDDHLIHLEQFINDHHIIAIGEVGIDTFDQSMKQKSVLDKQRYFFIKQLDLAVKYQLPVLLHIRKAHAESLYILKHHAYNAHLLGGIAHSFSGGKQEAQAFVKMGFKLGISGQICNPNAKKLRQAILAVVAEFGLQSLVIETDCPDMPPLPYQKIQAMPKPRNIPINLIYVLHALSDLLKVTTDVLAEHLWVNSFEALKLNDHTLKSFKPSKC